MLWLGNDRSFLVLFADSFFLFAVYEEFFYSCMDFFAIVFCMESPAVYSKKEVYVL